MNRSPRAGAGAAMAVIAALFLGRAIAPDVLPFVAIGDLPLRWLSTAVELPALIVGATYAHRSARSLGAENPSARGWRLLAAWLSLFAVGQIAFSIYPLVLRSTTPLPSAGDALYLSGYGAMIAGLLAFQRAYAASGLAVGTTRPRSIVALALAVALAETLLLAPALDWHAPPLHLALNVAYPALDGTALIALAVLGRTVRALRGGRLWAIWKAMLAAIALTCVGDIAFAYFFLHKMPRLEAVVNLAFMASYVAAARAAWLQHALLREAKTQRTRRRQRPPQE